ncbi:MAG TPA: hypothetical protein PKY77_17900 [Phycisphaerae bacterium]|nr:hypothetical protein [Phycisphaerae bacterium]HRY68822.1 hypothetical protein [Phycisphaerae bacterium]HSA27486.1 hypothetical protein [Phycisphaerae bacterium]
MDADRCELILHSFAEAYLYLLLNRCAGCVEGTLVMDWTRVTQDPERGMVSAVFACRACGQAGLFRLDARLVDAESIRPGDFAAWEKPGSQPVVPPVNPTDEASRVIDVAGWLTLFGVLSEKAREIARQATKVRERAVVRQLQIQAGQCLDEALAFYLEDNDLPPREAFFSEDSWRQFMERPALFVRDRLIDLRSGLPLQAGGSGRRKLRGEE